MKIITKAKLAVILIWIFTVIVLFIGTIYIGKRFVKAIYGENQDIELLYSEGNPISEMYNELDEIKTELKGYVENNPAVLEDRENLESLDRKCRSLNAAIYVRKNGEMTYIGNMGINEELQNSFSAYEKIYEGVMRQYVITTPETFLCNQIDYNYDNNEISLIILSYYGNYIEQFRNLVIRYFVLMVLLMLFLSSVLSGLIYSKYIRPLTELKEAAEEIGRGNLDVKVDIDEKRTDEIGELAQSFTEMQAKLGESVEMKMKYEQENRELISNISHDLKTPITTIKGYVEGIMDGIADTPEKMERYLKMIYNKANELDVMINELSLYTNINNNAIPYEFHRVLVKDYFDDCTEEIKAMMISENMKFVYKNFCSDEVRIVVDPDQLRRVINNIVANSIKYMDKEEGYVEMDLHEEAYYVKVSISDNGPGIAEKNLEHIFDRTFREDSARQSKGGSGLGLAICKKIVEEHGGKIWATSVKDKGTTISFKLRKYVKEEV